MSAKSSNGSAIWNWYIGPPKNKEFDHHWLRQCVGPDTLHLKELPAEVGSKASVLIVTNPALNLDHLAETSA
jgi:hypothetical protein